MAITSLVVKIGAQDEGIQKALDRLGKDADSAQKELARLGKTPVGQEVVRSLEAIDNATKKITENTQKMADRAMNMARGINVIGDASKFTSDQLDQMSRSLAKGSDAFRALGTAAPAEFTKATNAINAQREALKGAETGWQSFVKGFNIQSAISDPMGAAKGAAFALSESIGGVTLAAAAGVASLVAIGAAAFKLASNAAAVGAGLDDMADKTGMSVPALSRLQNAAKVAGSDLGTLTNAVFMVEQRMGQGGKKWDEAIARMGLSTEQLREAGPDKLLQTLASGLASIEDPALKAAAGAAVFGKQYKEVSSILPDLTAAFKLTNDIEPWTAEQAAEAEAFEMQLSSLVVHAEAFGMSVGRWLIGPIGTFIGITVDVVSWLGKTAGELTGILPAIRGVGAAWEYATAAIRTFRGQAEDLPKVTGDATVGVKKWQASVAGMAATIPTLEDALREEEFASKALGRELEEMNKAHGKAEAAGKKHAAALEKSKKEAEQAAEKFAALTGKVHGLEAGLFAVPEALQKIGKGYEESKLAPLVDAVGKVEQNARIANFGFSGMTDALKNVGVEAQKTGDEIDNFARFEFSGPINQVESFGKKMRTVFEGIPGMVAQAFTGGGGILGALKGIGSQVASTLGEKLGKGITALGSLGGPLGAAIGSLAGPLIGMFGKMFSSAEKQINPLRQTFVDMAGGLDALNRKAAAAGVTLTAMLNAKNPEQYKKAIEDLNTAFQFQKDALAVLDETAKRYGFTIEELGPAMARQELDKQAQGLFKDWQVLNAAGIDTVAITTRMSESVNTYVKTAVKMGAEVPAAMKPMLQTMIDQGLLTDAAGNKIENLEDSGITFATTMSEGFKSVVDEVKKLADAITRSLGGAISGLPTQKKISIDFETGPVTIPGGNRERDFAARGGLVTETGIQRFASGGRVLPFLRRGTDTVPAMLTPGEIVLNEAQQQAVGQAIGGGGADLDGLRLDIAGLRSDLARDRADAPRRNARALTAALQTAGLRK